MSQAEPVDDHNDQRSRWLGLMLPWIVAAVALALTYVAWATVREQAIARDRVRFDQAVNSRVVALQDRIVACTNILRGVASRITSARLPINRSSFHAYVTGLDLAHQYQGIQGVGFARRVRPGEEDDVTSQIHSEGHTHFVITGEAESSATATVKFPIMYIEPEDARNLAVLGYNMYSDPVRREAMDRAAKTGQPTATARVVLKQEVGLQKQRGLLLYCPVYNPDTTGPAVRGVEDLDGFAYSPLRAADLIHGVLGNDMRSLVHIQVYDGRATYPTSLLYNSSTPESKDPFHAHEVVMDIGGRNWTVLFSSTEEFDRGSTRSHAWYVLATGLFVTLVLFLLTRAETRARAAAERTNVSLRQSQSRLKLLNEELSIARDQALEASRAKSAFLANMSHELRTPLNAIIGYAELLQEELPPTGFDTERQDLTRIRSAGQHLLEVVSEILDLARIEAGRLQLQLEEVDLHAVMEEAISVVEPFSAANRNQIRIECGTVGTVMTDKMRLRQVLINLLGNAAKFTTDGVITLKCRREVIAGSEQLLINVVDTGIGIPQEQLGRLFENFQQVDTSSTRRYGGTGLGLAISRRLARALGGDVTATSEVGKGSTFTLTLPTAAPSAGLQALPSQPHSA